VVGEAADAQQGLELARTLHPDLVTLDLRMPGGSGLNVIKQMKQLEPSPTVIVLTNYAHAAYRKRAAEAGADFFFDKSSEFQQALDVFRNGGTQLNDHPGKRERS
jgi:DNA-binding NarL/FixJ family response regulator